ncbi:LppU/SCO3897 family protein [Nocardia pseudobrasiliensis]|uniref:Uncharacterized protein n=1 Tax=Nocardia pseudobrasiliensis TaxID=45979 RepID=A0A370HSC3_9NOCA|nr:hypothetical protein [Nocardia pseudobrasiliensis]RDI61442.1 hypothetical protein DFR76_114168 [Nocardia pseudobrasiliensis]
MEPAAVLNVRLLCVAVTVAVGAVTGCSVTELSATARAKAGDCLAVAEGAATQARTEPTDCSSARTVYTVVSNSDHRRDCGSEYASYEETSAGETVAYLCLAPDLKQNSCYHRDSATGFATADCADSQATVRVVARVDGRADRELCAPPATYLTVSEPKTTFCFVNPRA